MHRYAFPHLGIWLALAVIIVLLLIVFEVWMLVDVAINRKLSDKAKMWWIIGMVLIHPVVAIFYYFTDHHRQ